MLAAASLATAGQAQSAPPAVAADVTPVVVTATLIPTPADQVGSSITLITAQAIENHQWRTLPRALVDVPGVSLVQTGGPGGVTSMFIRGANANQTKVIIDGIEVNNPSQNDVFDFGHVLTADLERVEVLRGPQSSLYGADALGGVVTIVTRLGEGPPHFTASLEGGAYDTLNETAGLAGSLGRVRYAADIANFHAGDTPVTPLDLLAPVERRIGDAYDNLTASGRLDANVTDAFGLGMAVRYTGATLKTTGENFDVFPAIPDAAQTVQDTYQLFLHGEARLALFDGRLKNVFGVGWADYSTTIQAPDDGFDLPAAVFDRGDRYNFDWQGTWTLSRIATLVLGVDDQTERLIDSPVSAQTSVVGGFAELQATPLPSLTVAASVRDDSDSLFGNYATWRIAPAWTWAATGTLIKGSVGTGFKAPTLTQLFVSFPSFDFFANPLLRPETSLGYDIGFEQPLGHGLRLGATWFHNAIKDLIEESADFTTWANLGRATTYGVESFASLEVAERLTLRADYTWLVARDDLTGLELLRRPQNKASLAAVWRPAGPLTLSATVLGVGDWIDGNRDFSVQRLTAPGYVTINLAGAYDLGRGVTAFARIDNLLDRHYQEPFGFDKPGVGAFAGLKVDLAARR